MTPELPEEPPVGAVVLDGDGRAWQCRATALGWRWECVVGGARTWSLLNEEHGPLILMVPQPATPDHVVAVLKGLDRANVEEIERLRAELGHIREQSRRYGGAVTRAQVRANEAEAERDEWKRLHGVAVAAAERSLVRAEQQRVRAEEAKAERDAWRDINRCTNEGPCSCNHRAVTAEAERDQWKSGMERALRDREAVERETDERVMELAGRLGTAETKVREYAAALADARAEALEEAVAVAGLSQDLPEFRCWLRDRAAAIRAECMRQGDNPQ